jgi:enoyl-CoA hydratase/carnithine racemase
MAHRRSSRRAHHIATITLNRPDQLNSFTQTMTEEVTEVGHRGRY